MFTSMNCVLPSTSVLLLKFAGLLDCIVSWTHRQNLHKSCGEPPFSDSSFRWPVVAFMIFQALRMFFLNPKTPRVVAVRRCPYFFGKTEVFSFQKIKRWLLDGAIFHCKKKRKEIFSPEALLATHYGVIYLLAVFGYISWQAATREENILKVAQTCSWMNI